jgi:hypothetical protein
MRMIGIEPLGNVEIELPDQSFRDFGLDFIEKLKTKMRESEKFLTFDAPSSVLDSKDHPASPDVSAITAGSGRESGVGPPGGIVWNGSYHPAATIRFEVDAFSFVTGDRGSRMFYGFDERFRTPYNSGKVHGTSLNEFPLRKVSFESNWFDRGFDPRGDLDFGSHAGLDLSSGFRLDAIIATLAFKRAHYESRLKLRMILNSPYSQRFETHTIEVKGKGFFFDLAAAYQGFGAAISIARKDAMLKALLGVVDGAMLSLSQALQGLKLTAKLDGVIENGIYLIGTGINARVQAGVVFSPIGKPDTEFVIQESVESGALAVCKQGACGAIQKGTILVEKDAETSEPSRPPASNSATDLKGSRNALKGSELAGVVEFQKKISLPEQSFARPKLDSVPIPEDSFWKNLWDNVKDILAFPYRIWRYYQYDRPYRIHSDDYEEDFAAGEGETDDGSNPESKTAFENWLDEFRRNPFATQIGLDRVPAEPTSFAREEDRPVVAVIDTGVDYNHPAIHPFLWLNPEPSSGDRYGWDFISGDSRPYDDGSRGTALASAILGVAPFVRILPVKAFNPWGVTTSAALYASVEYAISKGARIILCGWATRKESDALKRAVALIAKSANPPLLIAAAGDRGDSLDQVPAYPASLSVSHPQVLAVASVDAKDQLTQIRGSYSNFGETIVGIAAPGVEIPLAGPRARSRKYTTTGVSAALVAGALARIAALHPDAQTSEWVSRLKSDAERLPSLTGKVGHSLRLRIRQ